MYKLTLSLIFVCFGSSQIFDQTADDMFEKIIGDVHEYRKRVNAPKTYKDLRTFDDIIINKSPTKLQPINSTHLRMRVLKETTQRTAVNVVTPLPIKKRPNITIDDLKQRMRKIHLNQVLETQESSIPDFANDKDNPVHITRRFEKIARQVRSAKKPDLRQFYFDKQNKTRIYWEKRKTISIMEQIIYATRYKLPYMQLLRLKYKYHRKYKIGYCFALLRHLRQQQKLIYSSLKNYYKEYNNIMIHMRLYEKVVRLDVDIKDVVKYVMRLDYERKLKEFPDYYDDTSEILAKLEKKKEANEQSNSTLPDLSDLRTKRRNKRKT